MPTKLTELELHTAVRVTEYLATCFRPISITAPIKAWKVLDYKCRFFHASINPNLDIYTRYPDGYKDRRPELVLYYTGVANMRQEQTPVAYAVPHPAVIMASLIVPTSSYFPQYFDFDTNIYNSPDEELLTFNTKGRIPNRFIRMLHDFYFNGLSTLQEDPVNSSYWNDIVSLLPSHVLTNLINTCNQVQRTCISLVINKAPNYYEDRKNLAYLEACGIAVPDPAAEDASESLISQTVAYMKLNVLGPLGRANGRDLVNYRDHTYANYVSQLQLRVWYTGDKVMSFPVRVFALRCKRYASLNKNLEKPNEYAPMSDLPKSEGGLYLNYLHGSPWRKLYLSQASIYASSYNDWVGNVSYHSGTDISIEEHVVLEEVLKKEGADFEFHTNH